MLKNFISIVWKSLTPSLRSKIVRATQPKFTVSAAAVVVNERGEVLLLDHVLRPDSGWGIPGGFVKFGEQPEKAVAREIFEETGLRLENIRLARVKTFRRHVEILFRADAKGEARALSREINQARWFEIGAIPGAMSASQKADVRRFAETGE